MQNGTGREVVIVEAARTPIGRGHPEKGYYRNTHPNELLGKAFSSRDRAGRHSGRGGRGRDHRLRPADRRAVLQRRPQRVAAGRSPDGDAGHDRGPPVRLRPAGRELRSCAGRLRRARRRDRRRRRAHGPHPDGRHVQLHRQGRLAVAGRADGALQPRPAGDLGRDDRRQVGDPTLRAGRARAALAPERGARHRGGPLRARDDPDDREDERQRGDGRGRPGHPPGHEPRGAVAA